MEVNRRAVEIGSTAAILGDPLRSLMAAARLAAPGSEVACITDSSFTGRSRSILPDRPGHRIYRHKQLRRGPFCKPIRGPDSTPIDSLISWGQISPTLCLSRCTLFFNGLAPRYQRLSFRY